MISVEIRGIIDAYYSWIELYDSAHQIHGDVIILC